MRWVLAWLALLWGCARDGGRPQFVDVAEQAGVQWVTVSGTPAKRHIVECTTGGLGLFDYDGDGDLDLFLVNGSRLEGFAPGQVPRAALYRNDGNWRFTEVGKQTGVDHVGWGMGCAVVDYDGDGWLDLYLTDYGRNALYHNDGNGKFTEVGAQLGVDEPGWSTGAAFGDYDGDGDLDFYLAKYIDFDPDYIPADMSFCTWHGISVFYGPRGMPGAQDKFFRNDGSQRGWRFAEISAQVGIDDHRYYGFAAVAGDYDNDGDIDIYVANDSTPKLLFRNDGGHFSEIAMLAGCAYSEDGREQGSMGIAVGDPDNDGDLDLFVTNFSHDNNTFYQNNGRGFFTDISFATSLGASSIGSLGWGTEFFDYDNDGDEDLFVANGHVYPQVDQHDLGTTYAQRNQLFENNGHGDFIEVTLQTGPGMQVEKSSRGTAVGDLDNDGDLDLVVLNIDDRPTLLRNDGGNRQNWLLVELRQEGMNRYAVGARVTLWAGQRQQLREVRAGTGYLSQNDLRLHFGLGKEQVVERLVVRWPDGTEEVLGKVAANQLIQVRRGERK
ncbi:MAG: CRTAC1 family protein [Candidatus Latescibacteria bacterium]|nr:CRTAC1 family protein [Candidatus Latescibacterota bacterium]